MEGDHPWLPTSRGLLMNIATAFHHEHYAWMWQSALRLIENDRPDYRS
jgi:hypothetical protein